MFAYIDYKNMFDLRTAINRLPYEHISSKFTLREPVPYFEIFSMHTID